MELEQILEAVKSLSDDEKTKVQEALTSQAAAGESNDMPPVVVDSGETPNDAVPTSESKPTANNAEQGDQNIQASENETITNGEQNDNAGDIGTEQDDDVVPNMVKTDASPADDIQTEQTPPPQMEQAAALQDEQGAEMPVDYQQIIDGLNAKNLALEAENKQLRAKVEGAFGLSGKPSGFVKANPLYDEASDIPPMRKHY